MRPIEAIFVFGILSATSGMAIRFVLRRGEADGCLQVFALTALASVVYFFRFFPPGVKLAVFISYVAAVYMLIVDFFERALTQHDFRRYYNQRWIGFVSLSLLMFPLRRLFSVFTITDIVYVAMLGTVGLGFVTMTRRRSGDLVAFQTGVLVAAVAWFVLILVIANGQLYTVQDDGSGVSIVPKFLVGGALNVQGLEETAAVLIDPYGAGIAWTFWFAMLGVTYHGLMKRRARRAATRAAGVLLIMVTYAVLKDFRESLSAMPEIGKYIGSPLLILSALAVATALVFFEIARPTTSGSKGDD
jgi:hypothetical protein